MIPAGLLPAGTEWCIAGGYAACPALARDIDVWVLGVPVEQQEHEQVALLDHLKNKRQFQVKPSYEQTTAPCYAQDRISILKVAEVIAQGAYGSGEIRLHLMVTDALSPMQVIDGFDVSTHQIALCSDGGVVRGPYWTPPQQPPVAIRNQEKTPERMARIAARFARSDDVPF